MDEENTNTLENKIPEDFGYEYTSKSLNPMLELLGALAVDSLKQMSEHERDEYAECIVGSLTESVGSITKSIYNPKDPEYIKAEIEKA